MNYLTYLDRVGNYSKTNQKLNFLVSGCDQVVREEVFNNIIFKSLENNHRIVIVDCTGKLNGINFDLFSKFNYQLKNCISGEYCIYNPLKIGTIKEISCIRQFLSTLGYDEDQKAKFITYLYFIQYIESLREESNNIEISFKTLNQYNTTKAVKDHLKTMVEMGKINSNEMNRLLSRYTEICSVAADFENILFLLLPFIGGKENLGNVNKQILFFPIEEFNNDEITQQVLLQLLQFYLEESRQVETTLIILDRGFGIRKGMSHFIVSLIDDINMHLFTDDFFTLCDEFTRNSILNRFEARIYSRHLSINSCMLIEQELGEMDVIKSYYNVVYDRRFSANRPLDILMGKNKTESYTSMPAVKEPRYRKEMIMSLPVGNAIVEYCGNQSVVSV